jgi:hypothetical protein
MRQQCLECEEDARADESDTSAIWLDGDRLAWSTGGDLHGIPELMPLPQVMMLDDRDDYNKRIERTG